MLKFVMISLIHRSFDCLLTAEKLQWKDLSDDEEDIEDQKKHMQEVAAQQALE